MKTQPERRGQPPPQREVEVAAGDLALPGILQVPERALGLVIFAHGSGSSRLSPRNLAVAEALVARRLAVLLFDLLEPREAEERENVFDIELLGRRVLAATHWAAGVDDLRGLPVGYFGASTGAAAALVAAAELGAALAAVVSRGGRPDLAALALHDVLAPTLLIVGSLDMDVLDLNRRARSMLRCPSELAVVEGASHLFEEPGTLEEVARLAAAWFVKQFSLRPSTG